MPFVAARSISLIAVALSAAALGCSKPEGPKLVDYLEEIEFDVPLETASYVSLGKYDIPIAATQDPTDASPEIAPDEAFWIRLQFELAAETSPENQPAVAAAVEAHRGVLSDAVISIVRTSSVDELADPKLSAVKARMADVARPLIGPQLVRQFVLNEFDADALANTEETPHAEEAASGHH
ncbi:hypothetical protein [Lacipirellula sp.]|uniref:hypothetical protein n=1 Tax=Lacipirellula sp. TaxID=2691419 RepID=UPI003D13B91F